MGCWNWLVFYILFLIHLIRLLMAAIYQQAKCCVLLRISLLCALVILVMMAEKSYSPPIIPWVNYHQLILYLSISSCRKAQEPLLIWHLLNRQGFVMDAFVVISVMDLCFFPKDLCFIVGFIGQDCDYWQWNWWSVFMGCQGKWVWVSVCVCVCVSTVIAFISCN